MFDDLATYFYENVVRAFEEYLDVKNSGKTGRSRDIRAAVNAATPLYHLREHLPKGRKLTWPTFIGNCPDYRLLGDIVNASKHSSLTKGTPQIRNATQIEEQIITTEYKDDQGAFHWHEKVVLIRLSNGSERNVLDILVNVMNFWQTHLHSIGVIAKPRQYSIPAVIQPRLRNDCTGNRLDFEIVQGLRFLQKFKLQQYNYTTGKVELMDLKGGHLEFSIYKPKYQLKLALKNDALGKEFSKTITLSDEESGQFALLKTDQERQAFLDSLPCTQEALRDLAFKAGLPAS
jgi:hypothetical protein